MSLQLSRRQLRGIREVEEVLLTPLDHGAADAWIAAVHDRVTELFGVGRSVVVLPLGPDGVRVDSPTMDPEILERSKAFVLGAGPPGNGCRDPVLERAMHRLAGAGVQVWDREIAERESGVRLRDMPRFYPEVVRPGGLEGSLAMAHCLVDGRAILQVVPEGPGKTAFGEDALDVMRLLLPAFKAGTRALMASEGRRRGLRKSLDQLREAVVVYRDGAESYRNHSLRRLLALEPEREAVLAAAERCAIALSRKLADLSTEFGRTSVSGEVTSARDRYRLSTCHLEGGRYGRPLVTLVIVRPSSPPLPSGAELRDRYALTHRQAEVALLLAQGRSNGQIAELLDISPHTARHHAQRVIQKVGVPGRKAIALRLLSDQELSPR